MKNVLRIITALIFIASGFVKAVDPVGFSFKLQEYFAPDVFNMPFLAEIALPLAVFVVVLELLLGVMLLLKIKLKFTLSVLIALCVFFAFLTFYSAYYNAVTDCGCFGDAIKFTPWQSFIKDIVLLAALVVLWLMYREYQQEKSTPAILGFFGLILAATVFIIVWGIASEPLIDFRDYKTGTDLNAEKKKIADNPSVYKTFYSLKNSKTGEVLKVNQDDYINDKKYWEEGTPWVIEEGKNSSELIKKGYSSEITKFRIEDQNGNDYTETILKAPKAVLVFSYNPNKADKDLLQKTEMKAAASRADVVLGVSSLPNTFKTIQNTMMDATAIKTIARSNPFVLILNHGKIVDKMPAKDFVNQ